MVASATKQAPTEWVDGSGIVVVPTLESAEDRAVSHAVRAAADLRGEGPLECGYRNATDRMVILRCCGPEQFYLERVIFPFEILTFQCPPTTEVEVWTHGLGGPELLETLRIEDLILDAEPIPPLSEALLADTALGGSFQDTPWLRAG